MYTGNYKGNKALAFTTVLFYIIHFILLSLLAVTPELLTEGAGYMDILEQQHKGEPFQAERYSLVRFVYLAANTEQPNKLWLIGSAIEVQEELFLEHYTELSFELGDEIHFRQTVVNVVAIESLPLSSCASSAPDDKLITYYVASEPFPLM